MASVKEADSQSLLVEAAARLKEKEGMVMPEWARFVKTGPSRERPPQQEDWWWMRAAAVLRKVYVHHHLGISKVRKEFSGRKRRGHKPEHRRLGSGKVVRTLLKQLEQEKLVKTEKGKGRVITPEGQRFLDGVAKVLKGK